MDARITKSRLANELAYDWLKILITIVVAVFFGVVVLSTAGTKPTTAQEMHLIFYKDLYVCSDFSNKLEEEASDIFSYEVLSSDALVMSSDDTYSDMALTARYMAGQRTILVSSTLTDEDAEKPYIEEAVAGCYAMIEDLDEYFSDAEDMAKLYYGGDYINGTQDEEYLSAQFRARAKGDKRYTNESKILAGIEDEKDRISMLRSSLITVSAALESGVIEKYSFAVADDDGNYGEEKAYAYLLGTKKMSSMVELMYTYDSESKVKSSDGICVGIYTPLDSSDEYMRFESLNYIAYLINTYAAD